MQSPTKIRRRRVRLLGHGLAALAFAGATALAGPEATFESVATIRAVRLLMRW
jgi:hypothetical protein